VEGSSLILGTSPDQQSRKHKSVPPNSIGNTPSQHRPRGGDFWLAEFPAPKLW